MIPFSFPHVAQVLSARRLYRTTSAASSVIAPTHFIYLSTSTNPYFNLSFEDWLFRHAPQKEPLLLLYRDTPCVVIGRNQNPWKEVNLRSARAQGVPWVRRRSGGGTVYHDLGNTNFSIHVPRTSFDRGSTAQVVLRAVRALGVDAHVNERNDICVGGEKASGSAYKIMSGRAYHHGTMLITTKLETLGDLLRVNKDTMITKGVASVRSPVCNLAQFSKTVSHDTFVAAVVDSFKAEYGIHDEPRIVDDTDDLARIEYIQRGMTELPSWDWAFGQTPEFEYTVTGSFTWGDVTAHIHARHGVILSCTLRGLDSELGKALEGKRYGFVEDEELGVDVSGEAAVVWAWLKEEMKSHD
ncbi:Lipoyltransferase and lipoate-protein ligase [Rhizopogon salebrosus TDB-379]|nr:Lipoyltransferase and lipoate-protein ligase [Rhizopogon salebrosus TDB-379]